MPGNKEMEQVFKTRANGKLLLTGEYFVLDGARALAIPVRYGQNLVVHAWKEPGRLSWTSKLADGTAWFLAEYDLPALEVLFTSDRKVAETLADILKACRAQNPSFLNDERLSLRAMTQNDFPREWGLGTSSTLIAALSRWAEVSPYPVLFDTMGGSGYDIACAYASKPILYELHNQQPSIREVDFDPVFSDDLYFVYLGKKQDSRAGVRHYRATIQENKEELTTQVSAFTDRLLQAKNLESCCELMRDHEKLTASVLEMTPVQELYFNDYHGVVKSLGAWGGDFVLAAGSGGLEATRAYFEAKGFTTIIPWKEMIL